MDTGLGVFSATAVCVLNGLAPALLYKQSRDYLSPDSTLSHSRAVFTEGSRQEIRSSDFFFPPSLKQSFTRSPGCPGTQRSYISASWVQELKVCVSTTQLKLGFFFLIKDFIFICVYVFECVQILTESWRGCYVPWDWRYPMWVMNHWAIS